MELNIIVATDPDGVIGADGKLPWHYPEDLAHFKKVTMGHSIIMGRKTHESIGKVLPGRLNLVVSRTRINQPDQPENLRFVRSLAQAINFSARVEGYVNEKIFVIGGAELYHQAIGMADRIHLTTVVERVAMQEGIEYTYFPAWQEKDWSLLRCKELKSEDNRIYLREYVRI